MQTIEFEAQLNEGIIHLPLAYRHWHEGQKVKIIVSLFAGFRPVRFLKPDRSSEDYLHLMRSYSVCFDTGLIN